MFYKSFVDYPENHTLTHFARLRGKSGSMDFLIDK